MGTLVSTSDKSSGVKSISTPSTPKEDNGNFQTESRHSLSLVRENSLSAELLPEAREDTEVHENIFLGHETPLVSHLFGSMEPDYSFRWD